MLHELRVENLLLMERAELRLAPGLNVLTGETGAGKTLLAQALDLLLGGKARSGIVRTGAAEAYVEGVFTLPADLPVALAERLPEHAEEIVVSRRVWPDGRTRAYLCGRAANLSELREIGGSLLSFYGQHEHRKLMLSAAQLDILDAHIGSAQLERRAAVAEAHERVRQLERRCQELRDLAGARERELDLVTFELDEIEAAAPSEDEDAALNEERQRLRHLEALRAASALGAEAIAPESGEGTSEALAQAAAQLEQVAPYDPALQPLAERAAALRYEAEDLAAELRRYGLTIEGSPGRLEEVEERLALLDRLKRKHGGTIAEVLGHAERCRERRDQLQHADAALQEAEEEHRRAVQARDAIAVELSEARRAAAPRLAAGVKGRLAELAMGEASFEVDVQPRQGGCGPRGADAVELRIAPNPGMPAGPLREIASGGELSRVMLALLSQAQGSGESGQAPLLVFDEIDAGVGGHTARAVGEHLRRLAAGRQILCITHLPQVAALAARHFSIEKDASVKPARTAVTVLDGDEVVGELVRMLGAGEGDRAASQHARELLRAA